MKQIVLIGTNGLQALSIAQYLANQVKMDVILIDKLPEKQKTNHVDLISEIIEQFKYDIPLELTDLQNWFEPDLVKVYYPYFLPRLFKIKIGNYFLKSFSRMRLGVECKYWWRRKKVKKIKAQL